MTLTNFEKTYPVGSTLRMQLPDRVSKNGFEVTVLEIHHDGPTDKEMVLVTALDTKEYFNLKPSQLLLVKAATNKSA